MHDAPKINLMSKQSQQIEFLQAAKRFWSLVRLNGAWYNKGMEPVE